MKASKQQRRCKALCCSSNRFSVSSSEEPESSSSSSSSISDRFPSVSTLAHAMVQERLDQMIREKLETRHVERKMEKKREETKFVVMLAMEKCSYDPREDFRESMMEMITVNRLRDAKDLRSLLNYYVSMNSDEYHSLILEIFHEFLGISFGANPRRQSTWILILDKVRNRLSKWKGKHLLMGGHVALLNCVLNSIPLYSFSFYKAPKCVIQDIIRIHRDFLWGGDSEKRKVVCIRWDLV
ncbi:hypothetical protein KIW84_040138 [Lathyrus oleraceus]|uniref:Transcription repressor n=1 Tax=Pisum sativum TaxID=3888 RepID=A0A9D4X4D2_PEA|nr:hypothetical protein KIW84_040138 [Pisum sativum]